MRDDEEAARRRDIGQRVSYWIRRRGMTRAVFAGRMGKSLSWVDKLKSGDRQLDRISVLRQVCNVLNVELSALVGTESAEPANSESRELRSLRQALLCYHATFLSIPELAELDVQVLAHQIKHGWQLFHASRYNSACGVLLECVPKLQRHVCLTGDEDSFAGELLVHAYQLVCEVALKFDRPDLGLLAADRGIHIAKQLESKILVADTSRRLVRALMRSSQSRPDALALTRQTISYLDQDDVHHRNEKLPVFGMLLLAGSIAAAREEDAPKTRDLLESAKGVARELDAESCEPWTDFSVANVELHRISAMVDLHEGGQIAEDFVRGRMPSPAGLTIERKVRYRLDLATAFLQAGRRDEAAEQLWQGDRLSRHEVRSRISTRPLIVDLLRSYPCGTRPPAFLTTTARAIGIHA